MNLDYLKFRYWEWLAPTSEETELRLIPGLAGQGDRILEVGAFAGSLTLVLSKLVGPLGMVVSTEPNPIAFARLKSRTRRLSNVMIMEVALSDRQGTSTLSMERPYDVGATISREKGGKKIVVKTLTADSIRVRFDGLILDAEGEELKILKGAQDCLASARFVIVEVHCFLDNDLDPSISSFMASKGFELSSRTVGTQDPLIVTEVWLNSNANREPFEAQEVGNNAEQLVNLNTMQA